MVEITFLNGTVCHAERVLGVMFANDDAGDKTYFVAQIQGAKRRLIPEDLKSVSVVA